MTPLLEIQNLRINSHQQPLVKGINLTINKGEILSIVGESGSGKSLTCLSILQLLPKTLTVNGIINYQPQGTDAVIDLIQQEKKALRKLSLKEIAYIFQEPMTALNPVQTCGKQIKENLKLCGVTSSQMDERATALLNMVELKDHQRVLSSYPFQLSGGQRQRVMIAMALAGNPQLLIADEPTTALDVLLQEEILGLLKQICKTQGKSMLFISHDLDAVKQFSDRTAVMYKGEIIETKATHELVTNPEHPYTKALLNCKPSPSKKGHYLSTIDQPNSIPFNDSTNIEGSKIIATVKDLSKSFGRQQFKALKDITFSIAEGDSIGLIGESGSGKSTISKILVELEAPSIGKVAYSFGNDKQLSSNVQMVFQDPFASLNPNLSVRSMLKEVFTIHRKELNDAQINEAMEALLVKVGLQVSDLNKYPNNFSGGQRQRLCIARALAVKPKLLICDEATSALDLSVQAQILNLIKELQISEHLTILMITHSMAVAAWFCNRIIVLKNGEMVEQGTTEQMMQAPADQYTKMLLEKSH
ncbi:MAG: ABC transporter ATP-binding protein [Bacteroidota bacterium]